MGGSSKPVTKKGYTISARNHLTLLEISAEIGACPLFFYPVFPIDVLIHPHGDVPFAAKSRLVAGSA